MTLISSNEFAVNQQRYLNLARNEDVCIQNGEEMYPLLCTSIEKQPILEPDEDFYKAITMEEVRERLHRVIDKLYAKQ